MGALPHLRAGEPESLSVPAAQGWLGVDRLALGVDLEVEVAADGSGVAGVADGADALTSPDAVAALEGRRAWQVGVEVAAPLPFAADQQVVTVEHRVVAGAQDPATAHRDQRRLAGGDDVEALVGAPAAARRAELADVAAQPMRAGDWEDVVVEASAAVNRVTGSRRGEDCEEKES